MDAMITLANRNILKVQVGKDLRKLSKRCNVIAVDRKEELDKLTKITWILMYLELEEDIEKIFKTITQKYVILDGM